MLDLTRLEKARNHGSKTIARCPVCAAQGSDKKGVHLVVFESGKFHCIAGCDTKEIFRLVGVLTERRRYTPEEKRRWARDRSRQEARDKEAARKASAYRNTVRDTKAKLHQSLKPFMSENCFANLIASSPLPLDGKNLERRQIEQLYGSQGIIWAGNTRYQSGMPKHRKHFRTAQGWMNRYHRIGHLPRLISGGTFKPGSYARTKANVENSPYVLIESDDLTVEESTALFRLLSCEYEMRLRSVVFTGGKSLHGIFERPSESRWDTLKPILEGLLVDVQAAENTAHSPMRLHGAIHEKTKQPAKLLWLQF